jgi:proteasome accessory factor B
MSKPTKLQRHLDVIAYLVGRRLPVAVEELMERIPAYAEKYVAGNERERASVRRAFERDKDDLRKAGIPLKTIRYSMDQATETEGYVIERRDFYMPYLKLISSDEEPRTGYAERARVGEVQIKRDDAPLALEALRRVMGVPAFPLRSEAKSAFRKLAFDLDPDAFAEHSSVQVVDPVRSSELAANLKTLSDALLARKGVSFHYRGIYRGSDTDRAVQGYALLYQSGHWYLIAHDIDRAAIRVFRVGRMNDVTANTAARNTPDYSIPNDFSIDHYVGRQAWELGDQDETPVEAIVRFRFPLSLWAERNGYGTLVHRHDDGSETRQFTVQQPAPFARWVLSLQSDAEIVEPAQLRDEVKRLAQKIIDAHAEDA